MKVSLLMFDLTAPECHFRGGAGFTSWVKIHQLNAFFPLPGLRSQGNAAAALEFGQCFGWNHKTWLPAQGGGDVDGSQLAFLDPGAYLVCPNSVTAGKFAKGEAGCGFRHVRPPFAASSCCQSPLAAPYVRQCGAALSAVLPRGKSG